MKTTDAVRFLRTALSALVLAFPVALWCAPALADGGVVLNDVTDQAGIVYHQTPPYRNAVRIQRLQELPVPVADYFSMIQPETPMKPRGAPGVAIFDYDNDGDLDIYAVNGPGTPNSLFQSQLAQTGQLTFVDVGIAAGVDATAQQSTGVCYGDIDNDGDEDLYVIGTAEPSFLFENQGDGTFTDITAAAGVAGPSRDAASCAFGDIDGDGLLDLFIANTFTDWTQREPLYFASLYPYFEHNVLFHNEGGDVFTDVSSTSGIENPANMDWPGTTGASYTWAGTFVDLDGDGDQDSIWADSQGASAQTPEQHRGWIRFFDNDGTGHFTDVTQAKGLDEDGGWMGLSFGDVNCDGRMDLFATNFGDYITFGAPIRSRVWLQNADGTFSHGGPNVADVFGWGNSMFDLDNDGDADVLYHGGVDINQIISLENPGVILRNDGLCSGDMQVDLSVIQRDHRYRNVHGVATGDLDGNGFMDSVSVSSHDVTPGQPVTLPMTLLTGGPLGSPFDGVALFQLIVTASIVPGQEAWLFPGLALPDGSLSLELNSGNANHWIKVRTRGSVGTLPDGKVNRDGIGAILKFTPHRGPTSMQPILGGSSYASENALEVGFGLGSADKGDLEVVWPGGVKNRLRNVEAGSTVLFPEIPCSYDGAWASFQAYKACVSGALDGLVAAGVLTDDDRGPFLSGAIDGYHATH